MDKIADKILYGAKLLVALCCLIFLVSMAVGIVVAIPWMLWQVTHPGY